MDPGPGRKGPEAAQIAELINIGPAPGREEDDALEKLLKPFNAARARRTDEAVVAPLRKPIEKHYEALVQRSWDLLWRALERERALPEGASVAARWEDDLVALDRHLEWTITGPGLRRTRQTPKQAALTLRGWEDAAARLAAQEALDDPLRMVRSLLTNEAIGGTVVTVDPDHRVQVGKQLQRRPRIVVDTPEPCRMPAGKALWWSKTPDRREWEITNIVADGTGARVELVRATNRGKPDEVPSVGAKVVFSIHHHEKPFFTQMPDTPPWTHQKE